VWVTDSTGVFCGICPEQTDHWNVTDSFTLPGDTPKPLQTLLDKPTVNYRDDGNHECFGPPPLPWCKDWSKVREESVLGTHVWTAKHDLTAHSYFETFGFGKAESIASGALKIVWEGHSVGEAVPAGFKAKFRATGTLSATCGNASFSTAEMGINVTLTPLARADLTFPPAVGPLDSSWVVTCPDPPMPGPFEVIRNMPAGLKVGDQYLYSISWTNQVEAFGITNFADEAEARADFPNTAELFGESSEVPPVALDFGVPDPTSVPPDDGGGGGYGNKPIRPRIEPTASDRGSDMPSVPALYGNVPNPFNPSTAIRYDVPSPGGTVAIAIYDVSGRLIRALVRGEQTPGQKSITWDGRNDRGVDVSSGVYFCRMTLGSFTQTRKMVVLR
jgi:hypothetical protein